MKTTKAQKMTATSSELTDSAIRNQVLLERLKTSEADEFLPYLRRIERAIRKALSDAGETIETRAKLNRLLTDLSTAQKAIYDEYNAQLSLNLQDIGVQQATFEGESYNNAVTNFESKIPDSAQIATALRVNPLQVADYNGNLLLEPFTRDFSNRELKRVSNTITQGFYQGQTNAQITRAIRGTKANNFNDGELAKTQRANNAMVRTAVQHVSSQARQVTEKENSDLVKGYKWVSTLDSRTTSQCQSLDGREFKTGEGPLPPIHVGCRSTTTPVLSESFSFLQEGAKRASRGASGGKQVDASETYYSWLKRQPKAFQESAIGVKRSQLLRNGGLTSEEFSRLSLNKNFQPLTLAEMRKLQPAVFEKANVDI